MKEWWNKATKTKLSDQDYSKLSPEDQKKCVPYKSPEQYKKTGKNPGSKNSNKSNSKSNNKRSSNRRNKENKAPKERKENQGGNEDKEFTKTKQDYSWWNTDDKISEAVANVPFNRFPGTREVLTINNQTLGGQLQNLSLGSTPGVLKINYIPTYGVGHGASDGLNMAKRQVYTFVRHQNSGRTNYEAADLMLYIMAFDQVDLAIEEAKRVYEIAMTYVTTNRTIPGLILEALGVGVDSMTGNLANFRARLNLLISKASSLCVPDTFDIVKRHALLGRNIFADSTSLRSQFYVFSANNYLIFDPTSAETGGRLKYQAKDMSTGGSILDTIEEMLDAILEDEDMNIMSGDILKAYGVEGVYGLAMLDENASMNLTMNEEVLQQIENSHSVSRRVSESSSGSTVVANWPEKYAIEQNNGILIPGLYSAPGTQLSLAHDEITSEQVYYNSHKDSPTYQDVLEGSRCMSRLTDYGTELIVNYQCYGYQYSFGSTEVSTFSFTFWSMYELSGPTISTASTNNNFSQSFIGLKAISVIEAFDWHPMLYLINVSFQTGPNITTESYAGICGDLKVYTILGWEYEIQQLHDVAIVGILGKLKMAK